MIEMERKYRFLILTDSVSLPRKNPEFTTYEETWPKLLEHSGHNVIQCAIGAATISDILKQAFYYSEPSFKIDYVIIQCGIVDCTPRFLKRQEQKLIRKIPFINQFLFKSLNKNWVRKARNITYTSISNFKESINKLKEIYGDKLYFISIVPGVSDYEKLAAGVSKNIMKYNALLHESANVIDIAGIEDFGVMSDYHHLNAKGHEFLFKQVATKFRLAYPAIHQKTEETTQH